MMNYNDHLRRYNETSTNRHLMSSIKKSCIHDKQLCMTCSNNKIWTLIFVKRNCALNQDAYLNGCILKREIKVAATYSKDKWWPFDLTSLDNKTVVDASKLQSNLPVAAALLTLDCLVIVTAR
jgi:hypothetical protein